MKLIRHIVFLSVSWMLFSSCMRHTTSVLVKKYGPDQLREDASVLRDVTMAMHPAVGVYHPRNYYDTLFAGFITSLNDSLTEKEFRVKVKLTADELRCGHTEVLYSREYYKDMKKISANFSPYIFIPVQDRIYVLANLNKKQDSTLRRGMEIVKINGITVDSMLKYSRRFVSSDGFNRTAKDHYIQKGFNNYMVGLFGRPDTFVVEYREGASVKELRYPAIKPKSLPALPLGPREDSLYISYRKAEVKHRFLDGEGNTMLMKINKFSHRKYTKAYRKIFRKMRLQGTDNLILDLRNNGGGSLANAYRLLSYMIDTTETQTLRTCIKNYPYRKYTKGNIWFKFTRFVYTVVGRKETSGNTDSYTYTIRPRKRNHFDGRILVLVNGGSFSATSMVAAYLKDRNRAVFIGEETGGALEGCNAGITPYYKLPNTRLRVRMPAFRIVHDVCNTITGQGVMPDYKTDYGIGDILSRRDLELEKARQLVNSPQLR